MNEESKQEDKLIDFSDFKQTSEISQKVQDMIKMQKFVAQSKRSMYLCYLQAGFTKAEALELIKDK